MSDQAVASEVSAASMAPERPRPARPAHLPPSRAIIWRTIKLHNEDAKRIADESVRPTLRAIMRIDNVIPKLTRLEYATQIKDWALEYIEKCVADLDAERTRLKVLLDDNGLDPGSVEYSNVQPYAIGVSSPTGGRYVVLLTKLDEVLTMIEGLWITGILDPKQHLDGPTHLCRRVRNSALDIVTLQRRYEDAFRGLREAEHAKAIEEREARLATRESAFRRDAAAGKIAPEVIAAKQAKDAARAARKTEEAGENGVSAAQAKSVTESAQAQAVSDSEPEAKKTTRAKRPRKKPEPDADGVVRIGAEESDAADPA